MNFIFVPKQLVDTRKEIIKEHTRLNQKILMKKQQMEEYIYLVLPEDKLIEYAKGCNDQKLADVLNEYFVKSIDEHDNETVEFALYLEERLGRIGSKKYKKFFQNREALQKLYSSWVDMIDEACGITPYVMI